MKKPLLSVFLGVVCALSAAATGTGGYQFSLDLNQTKKHTLPVTLITPSFTEDEATYRMPTMVPGTYAIYNFGRFVSNFHAYDKAGQELTVQHPDINSWTIAAATKLNKITYKVSDTWHADTSNIVFEPAGTNIEEDKNFVINTHGFFGYFDNYKRLPFQLQVIHSDKLYGSTALIAESANNVDTYKLNSYMELTDSPIMYSKPDTALLHIGGAEILVSVYDNSKKVHAQVVAGNVKEILIAANTYLGGQLPVKKYAFIIYLFKGKSLSGASGALEHSYSSVYFMPAGKPADIAKSVRDVASHEFFHIITPLSIHSTEIGNFDYANPKMSQHLWLYEGATEYTAHYSQLRSGIITLDAFMKEMRQKMNTSQGYYNDSLAFTDMSKGALDKYKKEYGNVYQKGALIVFCMDVKLRKLSAGKYGFIDLINDLSKKYGKDRSFNDDELFAEIEKLTYPEIGIFLRTYVAGGRFLPYDEVLADLGVDYTKSQMKKDFSIFGGAGIGIDFPKSFFVHASTIDKLDAYGKELGIQKDDIFFKLNGKKLNIFKAGKVLQAYKATIKEGDKVELVVKRKDSKGKLEKVKLMAVAKKIDIPEKNMITVKKDITPEQQLVRSSWMGKLGS